MDENSPLKPPLSVSRSRSFLGPLAPRLSLPTERRLVTSERDCAWKLRKLLPTYERASKRDRTGKLLLADRNSVHNGVARLLQRGYAYN